MKFWTKEIEPGKTDYISLNSGKFIGWNLDDADYLIDIDLFESSGLLKLFSTIIPDFDENEIYEIHQDQWQPLYQLANGQAREALDEIKEWVEQTFEHEDCFCLIGV